MTLEQAVTYLQAVAANVQAQLDTMPAAKVPPAMNTIRKIDEVIKEIQALAR